MMLPFRFRRRPADQSCACFSHLVRFLIWASRNADELPARAHTRKPLIRLDKLPCS